MSLIQINAELPWFTKPRWCTALPTTYSLEVQRPFQKYVFTKGYLLRREFSSSKLGDYYFNSLWLPGYYCYIHSFWDPKKNTWIELFSVDGHVNMKKRHGHSSGVTWQNRNPFSFRKIQVGMPNFTRKPSLQVQQFAPENWPFQHRKGVFFSVRIIFQGLTICC